MIATNANAFVSTAVISSPLPAIDPGHLLLLIYFFLSIHILSPEYKTQNDIVAMIPLKFAHNFHPNLF